ncbi:MAG: hypothetical protein HXY45_19625 [Syntrophaceae bacterium]|nr:hypothetical protein [Syntrophaceae bacterium]
MAEMKGIGYRVAATIQSVKGHCNAGHKLGQWRVLGNCCTAPGNGKELLAGVKGSLSSITRGQQQINPTPYQGYRKITGTYELPKQHEIKL